MKKANTISKHLKNGKTLDYNFLFNEGIRYLQSLSGNIWTDYNLHDPGLTILEYLCYALTDLAYRTDIDIKEVVYAKPDIVTHQALFDPETIYPTGPITNKDLRRLIMSENSQVRNCWVESTYESTRYHQLKKIYLLSGLDDFPAAIKEKKHISLKRAVRKMLMANRTIGEDFGQLIILKRQPTYISAILTIQETFKPEDVMVEVLMAIEELLNPAVRHDTADKIAKRDLPLSKQYEGPKQPKRIIDANTLLDKKVTLNWSEVQDLLLKLEGVLRIEELTIALEKGRKKPISKTGQTIKIEQDQYFYLDLGFLNEDNLDPNRPKGIRLKRYQQTIDLDTIEIKGRFNFNKNKKYRYHPIESRKKEKVKHSNYKIQQLAQYTSIQQFFPRIYGLGTWGLPTNATLLQRLHAKQLKGYLVLFEHFFSSYLAELSELPFLYCISSNEEIRQRKAENAALKYFPFDIPDVDEILLDEDQQISKNRLKFANRYKALYLTSNDFFARKNKILNHLLARFSESFDDRFHRRIYQDLEGTAYQRQLIDDKKRFLRGIEHGGYRRGFGFDYSQTNQSVYQNVSGFKKMICQKLGFPSYENSPLTNSVLAGSIIQIGKTITNREEREAGMNQGLGLRNLLYYGGDRQNYFILQNSEKKVYDVLLKTPSITRFVFHDQDRNACEEAVGKLQKEIAEINRHSLGFFMVEHILLRPRNQKIATTTVKLAEQFVYFAKFTVHLKGINRTPFIFKSRPYQHNNDQLGNLDLALLKYGRTLENWEEIPDGYGRYRLKLLGKRKEWVFRSAESFPNYDATDKVAVQQSPKYLMYQYLTQLSHETARSTLKQSLLIVQEEQSEIEELDITEFYQERVSFVFPNWVSHFFTKERRSYLEYIIRTYLPAHLTPCYHWLSFREMTQFQTYFEDWQLSLSDEKNAAEYDAAQLDLTAFLKKKFAKAKFRQIRKNQ